MATTDADSTKPTATSTPALQTAIDMATVKADPSVPPADGTCHFFRIPQEMRDEIYRLAYDGEARLFLEIVLDSTGQQFHSGGCCCFLVSKSWLSEAYQVYMRHNTFRLEDTWEVISFLKSDSPIHVTHYVTSIVFDYAPMGLEHVEGNIIMAVRLRPTRVAAVANRCKKLRNVKAFYDYAGYKHAKVSLRKVDRAQEVHIRNVMKRDHRDMLEDLKSIRGLKTFEMAEKKRKVYNGEEDVCLAESHVPEAENKVAKLEAEIREVVLKLKE